MSAAERKGFSLQVDPELLARIDHSAAIHTGGNRSQYILSMLPETYDHATADTESKQQAQQHDGR